MADTPTSECTELLRDDELPIYEEARHSNPDITAEDALLLCSRLIEARQVSEREKRRFAAQELRRLESDYPNSPLQFAIKDRIAALEAE